jgi:hypothetical protein
MTRCPIGFLITLALGLLVAPLGAEALPPGKISRVGSLTPEAGVADDELATPGAVLRDWRGLGRDTAFFVGYEAVAAGVAYLLPERVTQWTAEQRRISLQHWWANVRDPKWDPDRWYFNYLGHPYFGAIVYIRARERGFGALGGFGYAAMLSGIYEYGIEALFERPSYQDLFVTPVGGLLLGALLFEPIREHIRRKEALHWYDHATLALTDPLGVSNRLMERVSGRQTEIWVQLYAPALASSAPFHEATARWLDRPQERLRPSHGIGIALVFTGGSRRLDTSGLHDLGSHPSPYPHECVSGESVGGQAAIGRQRGHCRQRRRVSVRSDKDVGGSQAHMYNRLHPSA